jgi:hypothetical protein
VAGMELALEAAVLLSMPKEVNALHFGRFLCAAVVWGYFFVLAKTISINQMMERRRTASHSMLQIMVYSVFLSLSGLVDVCDSFFD